MPTTICTLGEGWMKFAVTEMLLVMLVSVLPFAVQVPELIV